MRILYFGKWMRGVACLRRLLSSHHQIVGVVAQNEKDEHSLKSFVEGTNLPLFIPNDVNAPEFVDLLRGLKPDISVLAGYTKLLRKETAEIAPKGCINLHGGRLPEYRGASTLNWQVINGERQIGLSIIFVDEGVDTGDVIAEARFDLSPNETITDVLRKSLEIFPGLLIETLNQIEAGSVVRRKQDLSVGLTYRKRKPEDGRISWKEMAPEEIVNLVRALTPPYPGAFTDYRGKRVVVHKARSAKGVNLQEAGAFKVISDGILVGARGGAVLLEEIIEPSAEAPSNAVEYFKKEGALVEGTFD